MATIRHSGRWTLEDRFASPWQYLPVEGPDGAWGLRAELEYEGSGAVLDLGCIGPGGFRGWSGGARRSFVITPDAATPGYLPGDLEPGTWQVVMGLHRVPLDGAEYRVTAQVNSRPGELTPGQPPDPLPPLADRPPRRELPASPGRRWLGGDLHTHTLHSDGAMTVPELARFSVAQGLDYIAVTDHNTISHHAELPAVAAAHGIILVPGQEVTTAAGHANAFGEMGWIDFREPADAWLEATERAGALLSVNHPIGGGVSWAIPLSRRPPPAGGAGPRLPPTPPVGGDVSWTIPMSRRPPLAEVWHWSWLDPHWTTPLAWWLAWDPGSVPVGGSDWHRPGDDAPPGSPTTWVECAAGEPGAVIDALRHGRTAISASRDGPVLLRMEGGRGGGGRGGAVLV